MRNWIERKIIDKISRFISYFRIVSFLRNNQNNNELFFFFPYYHVGGAERVHIDIIRAVAKSKPWIFFTTRSDNEAFLSEFASLGKFFLLERFEKKNFRSRMLKHIAANINAKQKATVFGCNNKFFYDLIPLLGKHVQCIDLIHAFNHKDEIGAENWSLPVVDRIDKRVFISHKAIGDLRNLYTENGIDASRMERVVFIGNKVEIAKIMKPKDSSPLKLMYVGRGTAEKRVYLIGMIAQRCNELRLSVEFISVGNNTLSFKTEHRQLIRFEGEIKDAQRLTHLYSEANAVLITSSREGFPMAIMEGMANGSFPISTSVGDIPYHISNHANGLLVNSHQIEDAIVEDFVRCILQLINNQDLIKTLSEKAYQYAKDKFSEQEFNKAYQKLLLNI